MCFNPYFNGSSTSTNRIEVELLMQEICFNPYFNGSSTSTWPKVERLRQGMEGFNPYFNGSSTSTEGNILYFLGFFTVSILILMDLVLLRYKLNVQNT